MPNWCDTTYKAVGTKKQVKEFYDLAMKAWNNEDNKGWLGHFVTGLGGDWEKVPCRGWMRDEPNMCGNGTWCEVYADTAWCEPPEWRHFIESKIKGLKIYYVAIEPGCDVYLSNDDEYADKYYVDAGPEQPDDMFMTEVGVCDFVEKHYQANVNSIEDCYAAAEGINDNDDDDEWLYIHNIEVCDD